MRTLVLTACVMACPLPAAAHMIVFPTDSEAGGYERYSLVVPTETESPTVRIELKLPMGVEVMGIEAKPGWQGSYDPFPIGAATVSWKGGRIPPGEMMTFDFLVWNPPAPRTVSWDAKQWYEDGTSDHWGEPGNADRPASATVLKVAPAGSRRSRHAGHAASSRAPEAAASPGASSPATTARPPASGGSPGGR